jgi:hypothetical protein
MTTSNLVTDAADAVGRFAQAVSGKCATQPDRVLAKLDGPGGLDRLCSVEALIGQAWPAGTAKELVWLTSSATPGDTLYLQAFADEGELLAEATFTLAA